METHIIKLSQTKSSENRLGERSLLCAPAWWVRSWSNLDGVEKEGRPRIFSEVSVLELGIWLFILNEVTRQIVNLKPYAPGYISISLKNTLRELGFSAEEENSKVLIKAVQNLFNVRLSRSLKDECHAISLFNEPLNIRSDGDEIRIQVSSWLAEVLLGCSDAHSDLVRFAGNKSTSNEVIGEFPSLALSQAAWLDFSDVERLFYLKLESLALWECPILHLEGVYNAPVSDIFAGLPGGANKNLMQGLKLLGVFGRKLIDHGLLAKRPEESFYACEVDRGGSQAGPSLVWQFSNRQSSLKNDRIEFLGSSFEAIRKSFSTNEMLDLWEALAPNAQTMGIDIKKAWNTISEIPGGTCSTGPTKILQLHNIFFEWALRRPTMTDIPLPDAIRTSDLYKLCRLQGELCEDFRRFVDMVSQEARSIELLLDMNAISIASGTHAMNLEMASSLKRLSSKRYPPSLESADVGQKQFDGQQSVFSKAETRPVVNAEVRPLSLSDSKMLRIANDELERMAKQDSKAYSSLKSSYFGSLEESQRGLMLDFQRRMNPGLFDQHLKQRLVRFMISNPGSWKSTCLLVQ
jgi:hypothetical protein